MKQHAITFSCGLIRLMTVALFAVSMQAGAETVKERCGDLPYPTAKICYLNWWNSSVVGVAFTKDERLERLPPEQREQAPMVMVGLEFFIKNMPPPGEGYGVYIVYP